MKKLVFIFAVALSIFLSAATTKFIGYDKTAEEYRAELAKTDLIPLLRYRYTVLLHKMDGNELTLDYLKSVYAPNVRYDFFTLCYHCKLGFAQELLNDSDVMNERGKWSAIYYERFLKLRISDDQRLQYCADILCTDVIKTPKILSNLLAIYIPGSIDKPDEIVVPVLKKAYLINVQRLDNPDYKPIVLKISLALKARGIEVK